VTRRERRFWIFLAVFLGAVGVLGAVDHAVRPPLPTQDETIDRLAAGVLDDERREDAVSESAANGRPMFLRVVERLARPDEPNVEGLCHLLRSYGFLAEHADALRELLSAPAAETRAQVAGLLLTDPDRTPTEEDLDAVARLLEDPAPEVRKSAVESLALYPQRAATWLKRAATHQDPVVRDRARKTLAAAERDGSPSESTGETPTPR